MRFTRNNIDQESRKIRTTGWAKHHGFMLLLLAFLSHEYHIINSKLERLHEQAYLSMSSIRAGFNEDDYLFSIRFYLYRSI